MMLRLLNQEAKAWWHHVELRKQGKYAEARAKERRSIRESAASIWMCIQNGGWMSIGRGGWSIDLAPGTRLSGHGNGEPYATILKAKGVLVWDSRQVPFKDAAIVAVGAPMPGFPEDVERSNASGWTPGSSLSHVPAAEIAARWKAVGAQVWNLPGVCSPGNN